MHFNSINILIAILLPVFLLQSCDEPDDSPYKKIIFEQKASIPGTGRSSAVAFAINGKGYVVLGRKNYDSGYLNEMWEYDPATDSWTEKDPFPGDARVKAVAVVVNNKAYVGLGFLGNAFVRNNYAGDFYSYDPITDKWEKLAGFSGDDTDGCFSFTMGNNIYVGSGYSYLTMNKKFWVYQTESNAWKELNELGGNVRFGAVGCSDGTKAYYGTGFKAVNENDWWEYDALKDTWKRKRSMPDKGRVNGVALSVNNRFFVATGRYFNGLQVGGKVLSDIYEYDPEKNKWHNRGEIPGGGRENAVSFVIGNKAYIGFGENDSTVLNDMYSFEP